MARMAEGENGSATPFPFLQFTFVQSLIGSSPSELRSSPEFGSGCQSDGSKKHVQTVSIVGFGGFGKTTLAKAQYDRVEAQFDCVAFVSVSWTPDITRIFNKMLYELDEEKYAGINEAVRDLEQLITELRRFLQYKRYLIVIDDIWDEKLWEIKCAVPENNSSCRIITTSRKLSVSEASCSSIDDHIYRMKPLSDDESQKLFYKRIFHQGEGCPPELEQVSKDILKKCGGVPLAIISVASLLATHHNHNIKAKDQWHIVLNSIGHGLTDGGNVEDMKRILSFSYYDLPSHLKACLVYLSIFLEDYEIRRGRLIWRWIAEGLIQHKKDEEIFFELGDTYFQDLINRSIIQPVGINDEGKALACRVHDMVLDLIRSISRQENFVTMWDGTGQSKSLLGCKVRRLSLQSTTTAPCPATSLLQVRSFTLLNAATAIDSMPSLSQFKVLRVLDLEGCDFNKCGGHSKLRHVGNLSQLRYLGLRRTYIRELPVETGKLQFLQTLDVRGAHGLQELPPTISGLRNLMCLHIDRHTRLPFGLSNLTSHHELTGLRVGYDSLPTL
ncbi:disease resistance protein RGA5-like [Miscanthus floridulus]|uniref:disease resistance protein RGA5-like n=1 Tax=Miscanthus floridulus TaxID=154761 RepID=UPI00345831E6